MVNSGMHPEQRLSADGMDLSLGCKMLGIMARVFQPFTVTVTAVLKKSKGVTLLLPFICLKRCSSSLWSLFKLLHIRLNSARVLPSQLVQGLVVGKLANHCTERTLLRLSVFVFAGVGLGMVRLGIKSSMVPFSNAATQGP